MRLAVLFLPALLAAQPAIKAPKTWDDSALKDWATPVAGLNVRPAHFSEAEYYRAPIDNLQTYPVYHPSSEPKGYWEMLQSVGPKPLIEPEKLTTEADWVAAGKQVFDAFDLPALRTSDPKVIAALRSKETLVKLGVVPLMNGWIDGLRWVPTAQGLKVGLTNCSSCHVRYMPDGREIPGAPNNTPDNPLFAYMGVPAASPIPLPGDDEPVSIWRSYYVPWVKDDVHARFKTMAMPELNKLMEPSLEPGLFPRWNGSPIYPTKIPDLIGLRERKYIDHTATHLHRYAGDVMRYAALVAYADISDFGPHRILTDTQRKIPSRLPDEALFALTLYIYSLRPPANPNPFDARAAAGQKVFEQSGCIACHASPYATNNKLTLAQGFTPPADLPPTLDVMRVSVGTDPALALKTRKGTGYYKVPSLKGLWYRGRYLHDGSLTKLEEMFDSGRLRADFEPSGFNPPGVKQRAIKGHEFGLTLAPKEREQLVAFLKTL
jgi:mono/diheme cytochrome c family protein